MTMIDEVEIVSREQFGSSNWTVRTRRMGEMGPDQKEVIITNEQRQLLNEKLTELIESLETTHE